ncbi:siderophore-interacting protein [Microbacteriaceae bacterium 4G12]
MFPSTLHPREVVRHPLVRRTLTVAAVRDLAPAMRRITLTSANLEGFAADGPEDHVKVFFPDPVTGMLTLPEFTASGPRSAGGGELIARDFTPRAFRPAKADQPAELDIDFVLHGETAPATAWATRAEVGDRLTIGGPRGSKLPPEGLASAVLVADPTALPALMRWIELLPADAAVTAVVVVPDDGYRWYVAEAARRLEWILIEEPDDAARAGNLLAAVRGLKFGPSTYVWAAGEATSLIPVRRYLRRELGFDKIRAVVDGYWLRGIPNRDHHAPLDPADPEE